MSIMSWCSCAYNDCLAHVYFFLAKVFVDCVLCSTRYSLNNYICISFQDFLVYPYSRPLHILQPTIDTSQKLLLLVLTRYRA